MIYGVWNIKYKKAEFRGFLGFLHRWMNFYFWIAEFVKLSKSFENMLNLDRFPGNFDLKIHFLLSLGRLRRQTGREKTFHIYQKMRKEIPHLLTPRTRRTDMNGKNGFIRKLTKNVILRGLKLRRFTQNKKNLHWPIFFIAWDSVPPTESNNLFGLRKIYAGKKKLPGIQPKYKG